MTADIYGITINTLPSEFYLKIIMSKFIFKLNVQSKMHDLLFGYAVNMRTFSHKKNDITGCQIDWSTFLNDKNDVSLTRTSFEL